jgi:hypothetical protein
LHSKWDERHKKASKENKQHDELVDTHLRQGSQPIDKDKAHCIKSRQIWYSYPEGITNPALPDRPGSIGNIVFHGKNNGFSLNEVRDSETRLIL